MVHGPKLNGLCKTRNQTKELLKPLYSYMLITDIRNGLHVHQHTTQLRVKRNSEAFEYSGCILHFTCELLNRMSQFLSSIGSTDIDLAFQIPPQETKSQALELDESSG
jgi:hypothetical protein